MKPNLELLKIKRREINRLKDEIFEISKEIFKSFCDNVFIQHPLIKSFGWRQCTPYSGATGFYAQIDNIIVNGTFLDIADWSSPVIIINQGTWNKITEKWDGRKSIPNPKYNKELTESADEIAYFLSHFDDDFYFEQFGDNAEIIISPDGISITEYYN